MADVAVEIADLTKRFRTAGGAVTALDRIGARIEPGRLTGLVGSDGAGKTTLMRLVAGLLVADEGTIRVTGVNGGGSPRGLKTAWGPDGRPRTGGARSAIGYMPESRGVFDDLTVQENLDLYADLQGLFGPERRSRLDELLRVAGLGPFRGRAGAKLSGGMRQKLALVCALVRPPHVLLLDEPSVGVDPLSRRELWGIVRGLVADGMAVLWSTAYLDEAERCDSVLVLHQGRMVYDGPPQRFSRRVAGRVFTLTAPAADLRQVERRALGRGDVVDAVLQGRRLRIVAAEDAAAPRVGDFVEESDRRSAGIDSVAPRFEDAFVAELKRERGRRGFPTRSSDRVGARRRPEAAGAPVAAPRRKREDREARPIEVRDLTRRFGAFTAVDRATFSVRRGEIFGLLGPNGAGKTTIFRMLAGLLPPSDGTARVAGIDLRRAPAVARGRIGYMSQHFSLYGGLTVRQNLRFFSGVYGLGGRRRRERMAAVAEAFDLESVAEQRSGALSLGYKQRLSLACAIMHEPEILFLDEPTSGIDPLARREFWTRINAMAGGGVTVLVTTHFMEEAEYCDRLAIVFQGRVVALGSPAELKEAHATAERPEPSVEDAFVDLIELSGRERA